MMKLSLQSFYIKRYNKEGKMSYNDFVKKEFSDNGWNHVADSFRELSGKNVLIFTHDASVSTVPWTVV